MRIDEPEPDYLGYLRAAVLQRREGGLREGGEQVGGTVQWRFPRDDVCQLRKHVNNRYYYDEASEEGASGIALNFHD